MTESRYPVTEEHQPILKAAQTFIRIALAFPDCDEPSKAKLRELLSHVEAIPVLLPNDLDLELDIALVPDGQSATVYRCWSLAVYSSVLEIFSIYTDSTRSDDILHGTPYEAHWMLRPESAWDHPDELWIREASDPSTFAPGAGYSREVRVW